MRINTEGMDTIVKENREALLLHQIFEKQVNTTPNALAIKSGTLEFTYVQIEEKANQLANYLIAEGIKIGDLVAIYFKRSELPVVAMLAILKAGAAYVPIDRSFPVDRIRHIIDDAKIEVFLTETELLVELDCEVRKIDVLHNGIADMPTSLILDNSVTIKEDNLCYIIYTSGSTGRPKGVMTQHYNVVHFVNSFKQVCNLNSSDRLYNGFAYSFDGSVEEIWMAFSCGASLIVANDEVAKQASEAANLIKKEGITFLSTVPTFLTLMEEKLPSVRLIILSGEVCPTELVNKWAQNSTRMLNVYGPTETTVNTTSWECKVGEKVTIGKPIPGYDTYILDENHQPVSDGEKGELYIGGKGLAKGYLNQEELTKKTFVEGINGYDILYKTGDLVSLDEKGEILFHGRIDSQVKIRGFRIELSEIESVLREVPNVEASVVSVTNKNIIKELVAYITLKDDSIPVVYDEILSRMENHLPAYMIPTYLEVIDAFPLLTSGKVNKKALPEAKTPLIKMDRDIVAASSKMEKILVDIWREVFGLEQISIKDNFFNDLGGHSLKAAEAASILRNKHNIEIAIRDIYSYPTIESLSDVAESKKMKETETKRENKHIKQPKIAPFIKILQVLSLYFIYALASWPFGAMMIIYMNYVDELTIVVTLMAIAGATTLLYPVFLLTEIALKWLIIGKIKPGVYPVNGFYYYRWWLSNKMHAGAQVLAGSPLMPLYYRLMGAKVGKSCIIDTSLCSSWDNLSIGNNTSIGNETHLYGVCVEDGYLKIGSIEIGDNCFIGIHSYIGMNSSLGNNSKIGDISALQDNVHIKSGKSIVGSPSITSEVKVPEGKDYKSRPVLWGCLHMFAIYVLITFMMITVIPSLSLLYFTLTSSLLFYNIAGILLAGPLFVFSFCVLVALVKKIVFSKVKPGTYKTESFFYLRKWFIDNIIRSSVTIIKPLYTTIYFPKWLKMLGAKVGWNAEISTVSQISPELMIIGDESFFADGSIIGGRKFYNGYMEVSYTEIGYRSFVGNSAILPVGTGIGDNCLIGVLSVPPLNTAKVPDNTDWLGSPSFNLPKRQIVGGFDETETFKPTIKLYIKRYLIDSLRIYLPSTIDVICMLAFIYGAYNLYQVAGTLTMFVLLPILSLIIIMCATLLVVIIKWVLMGRIKPCFKPLWSTFVWYNEVVNGCYESVMAPMLSPFLGTPFFAPFLRMLGCKIGRNVYMGTTLFSEFDLVKIDDNVSLNAGVIIQNHLFEDRIMKASDLEVKENCNLGNMSVVLYDAIVDKNTTVKPLSLVMKGEHLPSDSEWEGVPCQRL